MGKQMEMEMQAGQMDTIEEDVEMLRQILDNLVVFSFEQEDLMEVFKETDYGSAAFGKKLNVQNDLKQMVAIWPTRTPRATLPFHSLPSRRVPIKYGPSLRSSNAPNKCTGRMPFALWTCPAFR